MGWIDMDFRIWGIFDDGLIIVGNVVFDWRMYENVRLFMWMCEIGFIFLLYVFGVMIFVNGVLGDGLVVVGVDNLNFL